MSVERRGSGAGGGGGSGGTVEEERASNAQSVSRTGLFRRFYALLH